MLSKLFNYAMVALTVASLASAVANNTVYIISNAETPSLQLPGLTPIGLQRAQNCLPPLFAPLNIGLVKTCTFDKDSGLCSETVETATPIADALGLTLDTKCGAGEESDDDCLSDAINKFGKTSTLAILIVWDINAMDDLFENLNIDDSTEDGDEDDDSPHFDVLTTIVKTKVTATVSQGCPGIDGQAPGTFTRRMMKKRRNIVSRIVGRN